ncbi:MAG TPA: hypothetical protein VJT73_04810 [Polyangiaceae bacterium]|nr:hypothetical protein [Polyangiaceae bacterium]
MTGTQAIVENHEQIARDLGQRWGQKLKATYVAGKKSLGNWPGSLDEARLLIDAALGTKPAHEERELLALLVERGARRAWYSRPNQQPE